MIDYNLVLYTYSKETREPFGMDVHMTSAQVLPQIGEELNYRGDLYEVKRIVHSLGTTDIRVYATAI